MAKRKVAAGIQRMGKNPQTGEPLLVTEPSQPIGLPPFPMQRPFPFEATVRAGAVARVLDVTVEDRLREQDEQDERFGPAATTSWALASLRPGFFGLAPGVSRVVSAEAKGGVSSLVVELAPARPELVMALARSLCAFGVMHAGRSVRMVERGLVAGEAGAGVLVARSVDDVKLDAPKLPFAWTLHETGSQDGELQIDLAAPMDDAAEEALADLSTAFVTILGYGLLPAAPPFGYAAGRPGDAEASLPDQWTLRIKELVGRKETLYPLLEALCVLHARVALSAVEAWI